MFFMLCALITLLDEKTNVPESAPGGGAQSAAPLLICKRYDD